MIRLILSILLFLFFFTHIAAATVNIYVEGSKTNVFLILYVGPNIHLIKRETTAISFLTFGEFRNLLKSRFHGPSRTLNV